MNSAVTSDATISANPLSTDELRKMNAYWRAANYLSVGQIYLYANPLLREPLTLEACQAKAARGTGVQLRA